MTGSSVNNLNFLKQRSDYAWKTRNYYEAIKINKQLAELEPENPLWLINCMGNALLSEDKEQGLMYYKQSYAMLRQGNDKIFMDNKRFFYLMPWELQKMFINALISADFCEEAAVEVEKLMGFYCEIGVFRSAMGSPIRGEEFLTENNMPLPDEISVMSDKIRKAGSVVNEMVTMINSFHDNIAQKNSRFVNAINNCHQTRNYNVLLSNFDVDAILFVVDKRIDYRNVFFSEYPKLDNPDELYGGKGVHAPRAIMVYTSIEELLASVEHGVARKVKFRDLIKCLVGSYGEIIINPASSNYISIEKNVLAQALS